MTVLHLPAKSAHGGRSTSLVDHSRDVEAAADHLFASNHRWGRSWKRFFRLTGAEHQIFVANLRVAALLHDLGKANKDFVAAVQRSSFLPQMVRHEHLGALLLAAGDLREWLRTGTDIDVDIVTAAVLSHHLKAGEGSDWRWCEPSREGAPLRLMLDHPDVVTLLDDVRQRAGLPPPPPLPATWAPTREEWRRAFEEALRTARAFRRACGRDASRLRTLVAVKAGLIVADAVASGLNRERLSIGAWLDHPSRTEPLRKGAVHDAILAPRIAQIQRSRPDDRVELHAFQRGVARLGSRALLLAPCGAGKTVAAWNWAESQVATSPVGRVVFLYPTRGTATEGFRDYVAWATEGEGSLLHGTSAYEMLAMLENPPEALIGKSTSLSETAARLFALGHWSARFFSATVDQFLGFLEHSYSSLCLLPVLADSAIVIDEVHSFDRRMFDRLIEFLSNFDVPVLCMTATLPPGRRRELLSAGLAPYPTDEDRSTLQDLVESEGAPRYRLREATGEGEAMAIAVEALHRGSRVLWVVNQVRRAQRVAEDVAERIHVSVLCYHSRYRLRDRARIHNDVVSAFQQRRHPAFAVTTQVCEMSLDVDADVLVTETAPATSLVQRFGRAHRRLSHDASFRGELIVYRAEDPLPYLEEDLRVGEAFVAQFQGRELSQRDLAQGLEQVSSHEAKAPDLSARFLTSGYFATPGSIREGDGHVRPCVLDSDLNDVRTALRAKRPVDGWILPAPLRTTLQRGPDLAWLPDHLGVVSGDLYCQARGLRTERGET